MKETQQRFSVIDGSTQQVEILPMPKKNTQLEPVFKEIQVQRLGLDGDEIVTQRILVGFREKKEE